MRSKIAAECCLLLVLALGAASPPARGEPRWAAVDPNSDATSPVAWGGSEAEARARAIAACARVSQTCARGPAATDEPGDVFALVCCTRPRVGCAIAAAARRSRALRNVESMLQQGGYSHCALRHYLSAASGKRQ